MNKDLHKRKKSKVRQEAIEEGFYDGRFRTKSVPAKKQKDNKHKKRFDFYDED